MPASKVIRWPETFSSTTPLDALAGDTGVAAAAAGNFASLTMDCLAPRRGRMRAAMSVRSPTGKSLKLQQRVVHPRGRQIERQHPAPPGAAHPFRRRADIEHRDIEPGLPRIGKRIAP